MPNYEELYYIARNNYNRAIENRDAIRRNTSELQGKKTTLTRELGEKQSAFAAIQQKKLLVQEALDKYNVPLVKTQMKKIIVTAKTLYSHPKNVSKIYAALHTDLAW